MDFGLPPSFRAKKMSSGGAIGVAEAKGKKKGAAFTIDCAKLVEDKIMDITSLEKFLQEGIKVSGKTRALGDFVTVSHYNSNITITSESTFSKQLLAIPVEKTKSTASNRPFADSKTSNSKTKNGKTMNLMDSYELLEKVKGNEPVNKKLVSVIVEFLRENSFAGMFNYFIECSDAAFRIVANNYVTDDSGTGIVHCAPAFGEDNYCICIENQIISKVKVATDKVYA